MLTELEYDDNSYNVFILRNSSSARRSTGDYRVIARDKYMKLMSVSCIVNNATRIVMYRLEFDTTVHIPVCTYGGFWGAAFYREKNMSHRRFHAIYEDRVIRLLKFGHSKPDYMLLALHPKPEYRMGDKRFSTVADISIKDETVNMPNYDTWSLKDRDNG